MREDNKTKLRKPNSKIREKEWENLIIHPFL